VELGSIGVWWSGPWTTPAEPGADVSAELEQLGFGALWSTGGFRPGIPGRFRRLLEATVRIPVVTGITNVWLTPADELAPAAVALQQEHPGRFLLGLGASHHRVVEGYARPWSKVSGYLDDLDALAPTVPVGQRLLAALGPRMLALAGERSLGAHPYFVPVEHTAFARSVLGEGPLLAPEVTVVLERDPSDARRLARQFTAGYLSLPNYAGNLVRLGFSADDVAGAGSGGAPLQGRSWRTRARPVPARTRSGRRPGPRMQRVSGASVGGAEPLGPVGGRLPGHHGVLGQEAGDELPGDAPDVGQLGDALPLGPSEGQSITRRASWRRRWSSWIVSVRTFRLSPASPACTNVATDAPSRSPSRARWYFDSLASRAARIAAIASWSSSIRSMASARRLSMADTLGPGRTWCPDGAARESGRERSRPDDPAHRRRGAPSPLAP